MMLGLTYYALLALGPLLVFAQDGGISGAISSPQAAGYSCDPARCQLPNCNCASTNPPGGLKPEDVPQFIVFTADDAVQSYTLDAINQFLAQRKNPNGCQPKMTYFTSLSYTNYTLVTEINGNLIALNALAGIPMTAMKGFRAPFLNYTADTLKLLYKSRFTYDSSATAAVPVTDPDTDAYWPYTLDNGMANNCLTVPGTCQGEPKLPGLWEIPMYAFFDNAGAAGPHLMDPWLDNANGANRPNDTATLEYMMKTFNDHYNGNRQPIGLYTHPIHLSRTYPGVNAQNSTIDMINIFLDWAQEQQNVWIVSNEQLLDWVRHPVPVSQLGSISSLKCSSPEVDPSTRICNGIPQNQEDLLSYCGFPDFPFFTCYGCPQFLPTIDNPNPPQQEGQTRFRLPTNCSTPFWDPIAGKCLCKSNVCAFDDDSRPIGPNGANLTGGGTGGVGAFKSAPTAASFTPFYNGGTASIPKEIWPTVVLGFAGALIGALGMITRL
ncbi:hypothetical protein BD779DRAFT_1607831 [Infundibulicybe gibba]|nr:hypothetical protein BD779DRAFT_1607831 [Infundibulicybe gibba]